MPGGARWVCSVNNNYYDEGDEEGKGKEEQGGRWWPPLPERLSVFQNLSARPGGTRLLVLSWGIRSSRQREENQRRGRGAEAGEEGERVHKRLEFNMWFSSSELYIFTYTQVPSAAGKRAFTAMSSIPFEQSRALYLFIYFLLRRTALHKAAAEQISASPQWVTAELPVTAAGPTVY